MAAGLASVVQEELEEEVEEEREAASKRYLAVECHIEQRWLRRYSFGDPGFSPRSLLHLKKKMEVFPDSSSVLHPNVYKDLGIHPETALHRLHYPHNRMMPQGLVEVVAEEIWDGYLHFSLEMNRHSQSCSLASSQI